LRTDSDSPSVFQACNTTQFCYAPGNRLPSISQLLGGSPTIDTILPPRVRSVLQVAFCYLGRISEILNITTNDILGNDRVFCRGLKRSSGYLVFLPGLGDQLSALPVQSHDMRLFAVSYIQCYRACVRAGIRFSCSHSVNTPRTHSFRYQFARSMMDRISSIDLQDLLHHRNINSQLYYINK